MTHHTHNRKKEKETQIVEVELVSNFIKYWLLRKSNPCFSGSGNTWLTLIESNHKFRIRYGEDLANKLVEFIKEGSL